ncbi:hypothetical protein [Mycobacterium sp. 236(2023)]|uniref:hypothetical protein n=1 Tax=Mycobacterium sp. 236(2023) TaxID=3038163 RepID=UPI0024156B78|nr:hypothetical protein [Mycobacterium sp. 236(2023)]MDG4663950.1 hypothetical protein [Mycobacterium sp. 236(2023)]
MGRLVAAATLVCVALALPACTQTSDGVPAAAEQSSATNPTSATSVTSAPAGAPCAPAALPPVRVTAEIPEPGAPKAVVGVPDGWSMTAAPGGARLEGPDGMWATVTIAPSSPDAEEAFRTYTDDMTAETDISTVSVLPGELCGYPGQKLMGVLTGTDTPGSVQYEARIVHVTAAGQAYLIAVYVEAPGETPGFDAAATVVTGDFEISLP